MKRLVLPLVVLLGLAGVPGLAATSAAAATPTAGQSVFVPLEPVRLLDTREGTGAARGQVGPGGTVDLRVADGARVPLDATAVVLNVTATAATAATDVRVYPASSAAPPTVSNLNVAPRSTVANLVHVKVGSSGAVRLRNQSGDVHLLADLSGYFVERASGATYVPVAPRRLLDTRDARAPLQAAEVRRLQVAGTSAGAPADATAVVLNVTAVGATRQTDIRVWPSRDAAPPTVSNLNPPPGRAVAAAAVVGVGTGGSVSLRSTSGTVHLVVDLAGWYVPTTDGSTFHPVSPTRLLDTRQPTPDPRFPAGAAPATPPFRLGPGQAYDLPVAGVRGVPAVATAAVLNVTGVAPSAASDVRVYPTNDGSVPGASNLNVVRGSTTANTVVVRIGRDGKVRLRNTSGELDLVVDLSAWFGPTGDGWDISWPQCTTRGATTSNLPEGGGFAVIGRTRGAPFTENECFAAQWEWASTLPGEPSVYLNVDAPGVRDSNGGRVWEEVCGTGTPTSACGREYGVRLAQYALPRLPATPSGGRPMVWLDVEGPYANGPFWQTGYAGAVSVNRAVLDGAVATLRDAGYRVGIYTDRNDSTSNDWKNIMGERQVPHLQTWVFRVADGETPADMCAKPVGSTGGPVVMVQDQPTEGETQRYDVNHLC